MSNFLPGTASLLEDIDKRLLVLLRDGRTLIGYLRSIDQFANLVLHQTVERIHVGSEYGDISRGIIIVRGENVVLCGEVQEDEEKMSTLKRIPIEDILDKQQEELEAKKEKEKLRFKTMQGMAFGPDALTEDF